MKVIILIYKPVRGNYQKFYEFVGTLDSLMAGQSFYKIGDNIYLSTDSKVSCETLISAMKKVPNYRSYVDSVLYSTSVRKK